MLDFSLITSMKAVEEACHEGRLVKSLLLPPELGGQDRPENVVYIPPSAAEYKASSIPGLLEAVRKGMNDIDVFPEYRGASFVPMKITTTATASGMPPEYKFEIPVW